MLKAVLEESQQFFLPYSTPYAPSILFSVQLESEVGQGFMMHIWPNSDSSWNWYLFLYSTQQKMEQRILILSLQTFWKSHKQYSKQFIVKHWGFQRYGLAGKKACSLIFHHFFFVILGHRAYGPKILVNFFSILEALGSP